MATIGFIGLGNMGAPMAANLVKAQHHVTGYDLVAAPVAALAEQGGHAAASAVEAAPPATSSSRCCRPGRRCARSISGRTGSSPGPGRARCLIDCSTIDVETARAVAAAAAEEAGFEMLDAPVSGGVIGAEAAR